ncbi:NAD-dependent epimerase/dehydratase family protein [Candidatus Uhrbacteria bacterium]|nr:NAD-dependent epimerase/dehydratase family protein [Candidatus Uhrbacteria bacterium]
MSTYLITGGAGFIGSNLAEELLRQGHTVRILDNFSTGKREHLQSGTQLFEVDFTNLEAIKPAFQGVDGVFHMGALPSVPFSIEHPIESTKINILGTVNVLEACRLAKVKRVVYSASSSAYGIQPELPQRVDMPTDPLSPYALQKLTGEKFCQQYAKHFGVETISLRYFNVYGPRMNDTGAYVPVFTFFIRQKLAGQPLTVFGDGETSRDFTHVSDVVQANILAMQSPNVGHGEVLNAGAGGNITLNQVVKLFGGPVQYLPFREGDVPRSQADISLTRKLIGYEPKIAFKDGLREVLKSHGIVMIEE